jgi:hypothetical protein
MWRTLIDRGLVSRAADGKGTSVQKVRGVPTRLTDCSVRILSEEDTDADEADEGAPEGERTPF